MLVWVLAWVLPSASLWVLALPWVSALPLVWASVLLSVIQAQALLWVLAWVLLSASPWVLAWVLAWVLLSASRQGPAQESSDSPGICQPDPSLLTCGYCQPPRMGQYEW